VPEVRQFATEKAGCKLRPGKVPPAPVRGQDQTVTYFGLHLGFCSDWRGHRRILLRGHQRHGIPNKRVPMHGYLCMTFT